MTRFSADTPTERRKLVVDAITAHRERTSAFCTLQADVESEAREEDDSEEELELPPWIQFGDRTLNLDCTEEELERLKDLLREFPAFKIEQLESPEDADGTNVRISAKADANRIAQFVERAFREVYGCSESVTLWAVEV
ncbi:MULTISPECIES: hypothetical protein [unclassified Haladaptatus]|uniref:hypothetical protein n=1 Tax=unclassified Haladaptatus TaxID=2622732 RepID=UPI00209BC302|nr:MULTISPECIES: hypothetical protein [unclassified Haladaptatus]MCO8243350.1 hypothetical protein [Haladaptatus sp. AB643]MCO8253061.1 hypothetical protein [Haladaptatus sp. AB618]